MISFRAMRTNFAGAVLDRMLEVPRTMKAQGIMMHTMSFGHGPDMGTRMLSTTCASDQKTHLNAARGSELRVHLVQVADARSTQRIAE
jgi:hypothetical protein